MAGGVVGAASVVGVPGALIVRDRLASGGADVPVGADVRTRPNQGPVPLEPAVRPGNIRVPLRFRPTWLPDGFQEVVRQVTVRGGRPDHQLRQWAASPPAGMTTDPDQARGEGDALGWVRLMLVPASMWEIGEWRIPVTINGRDGGLAPKEGMTPQVIWRAGDDLHPVVQVDGVGDDSLVAQWMARSVVADEVAGVESAVDFGWLPPGISGSQQVKTSSSVDGWVSEIAVYANRMQGTTAQVGLGLPQPQGVAKATLRGRPGWLKRYDIGGGEAYLEMDDGLRVWARVVGELSARNQQAVPNGSPVLGQVAQRLTLDDVVRVVEELRIGTTPYLGWLDQPR